MKRKMTLAVVAAMFSANAFATYIVVLKNGTSYKAKAKWTVVNGKAIIALETGQSMQLDPALIDEARSEAQTKSGYGDARILAIDTDTTTTQPAKQQPSLGSTIKLRKIGGPSATPPPAPAGTTPAPAIARSAAGLLSDEVVDKFAKAYENVGLFEQKLTATGPTSLRAELTADTEDKVFNAISATSFLMVRNAGVTNASIDMVELFMKTTTGGSSGRFQMSRDDAQMLDAKKMSQQEYFIRKVIF
jgi:hypothetical protein